MKKYCLGLASLMFMTLGAQEIKFEEYNLPNGLHVILHQDNSAPVVTTSVMYHVGAKDEANGRTGFAHFFEHLLFEGTKNIKRGEWFKIVSSNGGENNANTMTDRTYYYEVFPSNNEQLGLWMEAERMRHPVINQIGVDTQREVVKEEKRLSGDNRPYGNVFNEVLKALFKKHPYKGTVIGSMEDLNSAKLNEFLNFFKKYYVPNNATLVVAGDIKPEQTKKWIQEYYGSIPRGKDIVRNFPKEDPIVKESETTYYDKNIQAPAYIFAYRTPSYRERDFYVLDVIGTYLSAGNSSVFSKNLVDTQKALGIEPLTIGMVDYGIFGFLAIPMGETTKETLKKDIDAEIKKLQTDLISEEDFQKLQNQIESAFVQKNTSVQGIASSLAEDYLLKGNTNLINKEIDIYRSVTREELREVAKKYLGANHRIIINYLPEKK